MYWILATVTRRTPSLTSVLFVGRTGLSPKKNNTTNQTFCLCFLASMSGRGMNKLTVEQSHKSLSTRASSGTSSDPTKHQIHAAAPPLLNPFPFLAHATENIDLASRLRSYSNTFGIIGALMCTLSITALTMMPVEAIPDDSTYYRHQHQQKQDDETSSAIGAASATSQVAPNSVPLPPKPTTRTQTQTMTKKREPSPILVKYLGFPKDLLEDFYIASWAASFYTSGIGLGLATLVAGIVAATAPSYVKIFVRRHSDILIALPIFQALSIGFAGVGLFLGLDESRGEPVSWIGLIGTAAGGAILTASTWRVLRGYHAARTAGKLSSSSTSATATTPLLVQTPPSPQLPKG